MSTIFFISIFRGAKMKFTENDFEFIGDCVEGHCYDSCSDVSFLDNIEHHDRGRRIHALNFDLKVISNENGKITVYAQTITATDAVYVPQSAEWTFITREFFLSRFSGGHFMFPDYNAPDCSIQFVTTAEGDRKMILLKQGSITIYAERLQYIDTCTFVNGHPANRDVPVTSVALMRAVTDCATTLAQDVQAVDNIPARMLNNVILLLSSPGARGLVGAVDIMNKASVKRSELLDAFLNPNLYFIPGWSPKNYTAITQGTDSIIDEFKLQKRTFENSQSATSRVASAGVMAAKATELGNALSGDFEQVRSALNTGMATITKLDTRYTNAKTLLFQRKNNLTKIMMNMKYSNVTVTNLLNSLDVIFSVVNDPSALPPLRDNLPSDKASSQVLLDSFTTIGLLEKILEANSNLKDRLMHNNDLSAGDRAYINTIGDGYRLRKASFGPLKDAADKVLRGISTVSGLLEYRLTLSEVIMWGQALMKETARISTLIQSGLQKRVLRDILKTDVQRTKQAIVGSQGGSITGELVASVKFLSKDFELLLSNVLGSFCHSYYYYQLDGCPSNIKPLPSDDVAVLAAKLEAAKVAVNHDLGQIRGNVLHIRQQIQIFDATGNCDDVRNCPVSYLRKDRSIVVSLSNTIRGLSQFSRIRLDEIGVELSDAMPRAGDNILKVFISTVGDFEEGNTANREMFSPSPWTCEYLQNSITGNVA
jgi:hypothetical protein